MAAQRVIDSGRLTVVESGAIYKINNIVHHWLILKRNLRRISHPQFKCPTAMSLFQTKILRIYDENDHPMPIFDLPLWFNPEINVKFVKTRDRRGITFVKNLLNMGQRIKTKHELFENFRVNFNFTDYSRLIRSEPSKWTIDRENWDPLNQEACQPIYSLLLQISSLKQN